MKRLIFLLLTIISFNLSAQDTISVLWLGNSYTGNNNLPQLTRNVANSVNNHISYQSHTPGGERLLEHASNATAMSKIFSQPWDFVTLQAQSQEPSWPQWQVQNEVFPYAEQLCDSIRANNGCAKPVFYMTWGRENGDAFNCNNGWLPVCTYEGMDSILYQNYMLMGDDNKALVSPVGAVWRYLRENHPTIDLYANDGSHPSQRGSYAGALSFYAIFFQSNPELIPYNYTLDSATADTIKKAVKIVVFDSLNKWNVGVYDGINELAIEECDSFQYNGVTFLYDTSFTDTLFGQSEFGCDSFVNTDIKINKSNTSNITINTFDDYQFGDALLTESGNYTQLFSTSEGCDSIVNLNLNYEVNDLNKSVDDFKIYPNPARQHIEIISEKRIRKGAVLSLEGKLKLNFEDKNIDMSNLVEGLYLLRVEFENGETKIQKLIIQK